MRDERVWAERLIRSYGRSPGKKWCWWPGTITVGMESSAWRWGTVKKQKWQCLVMDTDMGWGGGSYTWFSGFVFKELGRQWGQTARKQTPNVWCTARNVVTNNVVISLTLSPPSPLHATLCSRSTNPDSYDIAQMHISEGRLRYCLVLKGTGSVSLPILEIGSI